MNTAAQLRQRVAELEAANARLRAALQDIAEIKDEYFGGDWDEIERAREIARHALEESTKED